MKNVYEAILAITFIFLVYTYGVRFDGHSESELITMSYFWVPALAFSIVGLITLKKEENIKYSISAGIGALGLLIMFFEAIWPSL